MLDYALMGAQAAGLVGDIWSSGIASRIAGKAQSLEEAQLDLRLKQERIASNEQSLANLEQLAETLATQRALMSVRGGLPGVGSSLTLEAKSVARFNKDEQARQLSLEFAGEQLKARKSVGRIALAGQRAAAGASQFNKAFQMIPFSEMASKMKTPAKTPTPRTTGIPNKQVGLLSPQRGFNG